MADLISDIQMNQQQEIDECRMEKKKIYNQHLALLGQIVDILETLITKYYCGSIASSNATVVRNLSVEVECLLSYTQTKALEIEVQVGGSTSLAFSFRQFCISDLHWRQCPGCQEGEEQVDLQDKGF